MANLPEQIARNVKLRESLLPYEEIAPRSVREQIDEVKVQQLRQPAHDIFTVDGMDRNFGYLAARAKILVEAGIAREKDFPEIYPPARR